MTETYSQPCNLITQRQGDEERGMLVGPKAYIAKYLYIIQNYNTIAIKSY